MIAQVGGETDAAGMTAAESPTGEAAILAGGAADERERTRVSEARGASLQPPASRERAASASLRIGRTWLRMKIEATVKNTIDEPTIHRIIT